MTIYWIFLVAVAVAACACVIAYEALKPVSDSYKKMMER